MDQLSKVKDMTKSNLWSATSSNLLGGMAGKKCEDFIEKIIFQFYHVAESFANFQILGAWKDFAPLARSSPG